MTLELDSYHQNVMASKGRSASICAPGCSPMEAAAIAAAAASGRRHLPPQHANGRNVSQEERQYGNRGSAGNMHIANSTSTPTRSRKHGTHRSQSARVVGSQRPKVKRREQELQDYDKHLDLASSEGAIGDCQESYNPFLNKVGSTGRLVTSTSLEMSQNCDPAAAQANTLPHHQQIAAAFLLSAEPSKDSPHLRRRHSGSSYEHSGRETDRRGSSDQQKTPEKEKMCFMGGGGPMVIPTIATPESSPQPMRRNNSYSRPSGLPKSPTTPRSTGSARRVNSMKAPRRTQERYLDVPDNGNGQEDDEDEEYRLRSFSLTPKGIVNRGDSFRRRRSRSNSLIPTPTTPEAYLPLTSDDGLLLPANATSKGNSRNASRSNSRRSSRASPNQTPNQSPRPSIAPQPPSPTGPTTHYRVAMIGGRGVGKNALISQFLTSDSINAYEGQDDVEGEKTVSVMLNGEESEVTFFKLDNTKTELSRENSPDGFLLVYSVVDRGSFQRVESELRRLQEMDLLRTKAVVIVANKIDLARSRSISTQDGKCLAVAYRVKFIEVSVGINHNVDELLVGALNQIRLKTELTGIEDGWCKHRGILKASAKARQMLTWLLGKEDAKFKNCENLHVL